METRCPKTKQISFIKTHWKSSIRLRNLMRVLLRAEKPQKKLKCLYVSKWLLPIPKLSSQIMFFFKRNSCSSKAFQLIRRVCHKLQHNTHLHITVVITHNCFRASRVVFPWSFISFNRWQLVITGNRNGQIFAYYLRLDSL